MKHTAILAVVVVVGWAPVAAAFAAPHSTSFVGGTKHQQQQQQQSSLFVASSISDVLATNGVAFVEAKLPKTATVATAPMVAQRWRKSTKQVATLGPASSSKEMIEKLFLAGTDVFRLNFSHGSQEQKKELLLIIREIEEKYSHPIAILGDLQGPKLRVRVCVCVCRCHRLTPTKWDGFVACCRSYLP